MTGGEIIIASLIIGGITAYTSYTETEAANERARIAAINRNQALSDQYKAEEMGMMVRTERETSKLAHQKWIKQQAIAASMVGAGRAPGTGSAGVLTAFVGESYSSAAGQFASDATTSTQMAWNSTVAQQQASWNSYLNSRQNAMLGAISTGISTTAGVMSIGAGMQKMGGQAKGGGPKIGGKHSIFSGDFWNQWGEK